jgi:hypothetical protein
MQLTWIRPLHGSAAIITKTVVKTVDGLSKMLLWAGFHRSSTGHNMIKAYPTGTNLKIEQGLQVSKTLS